jgi:glucose/arabinose dehydrogenase
MTHRSLIVALAVGSIVAIAPSAQAVEPAVVLDGLRFPAGIAFDSQDTMFVTEREGRILAFDGATTRTVASIPTVTDGETGLLGIAMSPDDRYVYVFATEQDRTNTVWRVLATGGDPERVVTGLPGGVYHNGGGVAFGPDGNLYVSNGERHDSGLAQDPNVLGGKVYRFTPDGEIPPDNPFGDSPTWAFGLRNPFGIAIDPMTGNPFVTENGPEAFDEINQIEAGGNYGWPEFYGPAPKGITGGLQGDYHDPMLAYEDIVVPTGIAFADPFNALPSFAGDMFFGTYGAQTIHRVVMDRARTRVIEDVTWYQSREPVIAVAWGPRGLYFSTPGAVKLFELARGLGQTEGGSAAPPAPASIDQPGSDLPVAGLLIGGAAVLLAGALLYAFGGKRRGRT